MHEIERRVLIALPPILGIDVSITNEVVLVWLAAAVTLALLFFACRRSGPVAKGYFQNLFEALMDFVEKEVVKGNLGTEGRAWLPFLLALFFFILLSNLLGLVPLPSVFKATTSNINVTAGLALIVFLLTIAISIRQHGVLGFVRKFLPSGLPRWVAVLVIPIEIISWLAKPASLAIRLFANMMAGHALIFVFIGMTMTVSLVLKPIPLLGAIVMSGFELFVCFIQAFIFTMLTGLYIGEALETR